MMSAHKNRLITRQNILFVLGIVAMASQIVAPYLHQAFSIEIFLGGMTLCGVGITQRIDKG